jgi:histidine ammonia-lyase
MASEGSVRAIGHVQRLGGALLVAGLLLCLPAVAGAQQQEGFTPINPTKAHKTITLTGEDLSTQDVVDIARHGAKVRIAREHTNYMNRAYNLIIEAARQEIPVYRFNRGAGAARETVIFEGDPYEPANLANLQTRRLNAARNGAWEVEDPYRPYVESEEIVRAMMAVRANNIKYVANGPATAQKIADLLNHRITPLTQGDGFYHGEGDLPQAGNVESAIFGFGEVFYNGQRMPAMDALGQAGLEPGGVDPDDRANDMGLFRGIYSTNAYTLGQAALLIHDAKKVLDWHDLIFSVSMNGLNSSVTPLSAVPQRIERPLPYANWQAERLLEILDGSYLFDLEFQIVDGEVQGIPRLLQDPLSYRTYPQRNGAAWRAWDELRRTTTIEINSSDHNPSTAPGTRPWDSPELRTPWFMRHYVKPTPRDTPFEGWRSEGGFTLSNSNFNKTELAGNVEQFVIALTDTVHTIALRTLRIGQPFFSVIAPGDVLSPEVLARAAPEYEGPAVLGDLVDELQVLTMPIPVEMDPNRVHPDETFTFGSEKVAKARLALDVSLRLIAQEALSATFWTDVREAQRPARSFGDVPECAWEEFREVIPWQAEPGTRPSNPGEIAYEFLRENEPAECLGDTADAPRIGHRGSHSGHGGYDGKRKDD